MAFFLDQCLIQFRCLVLESSQEDRFLVHLLSVSVVKQGRWAVLNRGRVQFVVVDSRQIPLTAADQIDDRGTLQAHAVTAVAPSNIRSRAVDQVRRGLVVLGGVVQIALGLTRQLLHVYWTEVSRVSIHAVHVEALAAVQRFVCPGWLCGPRVLKDARRVRGGWLAGVDDGDVAPNAIRL